MAELRHATVAAAAARASSSPAKRDAEAATSASSPFLPSPRGGGDGGKDGALRSSPPLHQRFPLPGPVRALLALEDPRSPSAPTSYRILLAVLACLALAALVSAPSVWSRLNAPYLCRKDGIRLQCPGVSGRGSLWENPRVAAMSWKPCAERRSDEISGTQIPKYTYLEDGGTSSKNYSNFCPNQNKTEAHTASYTLNSNYVNMQTKTPPWTYDYNSKEAEQGDLEDRYAISLSQGNGMSFTEMLLSVEAPSTSQSYLQSDFNGMEEVMGSENKTFMITGRYASSQSTLLDVQEEEEEESYKQPVFGDDDEELDEDETTIGNEDLPNYGSDSYYNWQFDHNENQNNDPVHNGQHIPEENNSFDNETHNNEDGEEVDMDMPEGVEKLTQEDIRIFLENESVVAALQASQEVTGHHAPHLNMVFNTEEEAYKFYNEYASICVFSVKKAGNYKGKNIGNAIGTRRTYTCSKFGKVVAPEVIEERKKKRQERNQQRAGSGPPPKIRKRRRNVNPVSGCKAKMVVTLKGDKWVVTNLELHHNHELSRPDESKFLASHRHMTDQEKLFIHTFTSVKLPARKIMAILTYLRGGKPKNVPYNKKYVSNVMTAIRLEDNTNDMMKVLSYFRQRQEEDPRFYYNFDLGEGNKVKCIFWSDGFSRHMYDLYGDCLSFDTTFKTNKYNLPFAPFVGVTGHGHNCLFACAIINNEQASTFEWLFEEFLICMGGKHPATIITDQDAAMAKAIDEVFKQTCHRNCFFHIKRKSEEKCGGSFSKIPNLHADFSDILRNSLTIAEFEHLWPEMISRYNVGHLKYLKIMWENRAKFVPVYFKHNFLPFIHSTARSEGTNAIFKDNVGSTYSVISFLGEYQKISENIEELEREQDSVTRITEPDYWVRSEIELQAGRMYNRKIFYRFQKQIMFTTKLHVQEVQKFVRYEVYKTPMLQLQDFRSRKYLVSVNLQAEEFACICCKFEKDGIICAHILRVLIHLNLSELPEKYYISRWRPKDRKYIRDKQSIPIDLTTSNKHLRYCVLCRKFCNIASEGAVTERKYLFLLDEIKRIEDRLDEMTQEDETAEFQKREKGKQPSATSEQQKAREQQHKDGFPDNLQDPDVVPSKGRPENSKRQKTFVEELLSKNQITCSHCGSHHHNIATCTMRHIPKSFFEKSVKTSNKKTAGKADAEKSTKKQTQKRNQAKSTGNMKKTSSKSQGKKCL